MCFLDHYRRSIRDYYFKLRELGTLKCLIEYFLDHYRCLAGAYYFKLCLAPIRPCTPDETKKPHGDCLLRDQAHYYGFFLYPDHIRLWFFPLAVVLVLLLGKASIWWGVSTFLVFSVGYVVLFYVVRCPVLSDVWKHWPQSMDIWLLNIPQRIDLRRGDVKSLLDSPHPLDQRLGLTFRRYNRGLQALLPIVSFKPPANRQPASLPLGELNPQKLFLRAAVIDIFCSGVVNRYLNAGLLNWIVFWGFPIWLGFISLLAPILFYLFSGQPLCAEEAKLLVFSALIWVVLSSIFLWRQIRFLGAHDWRLEQSAIDTLPTAIQRHLHPYATLPELLSGLRSKAVFAIIYAAVFGLYLTLVNLVMEQL